MAGRRASELCLAAFSLDFPRFLDEKELKYLRQTSRLLCTVFELHTCRPDRYKRAQGVLSMIQHQDALARELRSVLLSARTSASLTALTGGKRSKSGFLRLREDQLCPLVKDLVLVGLGVRASCLVDTCQLDHEHVRAMITAFSCDIQWREYGLHHLSAVQVAGNVFFVHRAEFVRLKCLELASDFRNVVLVNAIGDLKRPQQISDRIEHGREVRRQLVESTKQLVDSAVGCCSSKNFHDTPIQLDTRGVCSTAMAGVILCYPVAYHLGAASFVGDNDPSWSTSTNCLGMCPLLLFQTSLLMEDATINETHKRIALQEFSIPQQLHTAGKILDASAVLSHRIVVQCRRALEQAIGATGLLSIDVDVTTRTLSHVAL